jgi:hypothetical protein
MKHYRAVLLASTMLVSTLPLFGCGNSSTAEGPSGSYIRDGVTLGSDRISTSPPAFDP